MRSGSLKYGRSVWAAIFLAGFLGAQCAAQTAPGSLHGTVKDPSGALVTNASVTATSSNGEVHTATTNAQGAYTIRGLTPGTYSVTAVANGFDPSVESNIALAAGAAQQVDFALEIAVEEEKVQVEEQGSTVAVAPSDNASSVVIKGKDLEALSDDPDQLLQDLEALAGPSAGPNGGQIYIDGFTAGQLPPKSAIREIRINQNPFSAEYDKLGYGRIEILTKPGSDQYHGQFFVHGNSSALNSQNPFVTEEPSYESEHYNGTFGGPLGKKASFFISAERRDIADNAIVSAVVLDPNFNPAPFSQGVLNPRVRTNLSPRVDYQLSNNDTLTIRYQFTKSNEDNGGIGQFSLPSQGYNTSRTEHTFQASNTHLFSARTVNETRFQYIRDRDDQFPLDTAPALLVLGAFNGGGNAQGTLLDNIDRYELQNYTSMSLGKHFVKFGGRVRALTDSNHSTTNFNGTFTFSSLTAYQITLQGLQQGWTPAQIRAAGGGASQFSMTTGSPLTDVTLVDTGLFVQDDWRIRPSLTLSYGLRFESQNNIHDHADLAPRLTIAWGIGHGGNPKTVLRAGFGMFYDRFQQDLILQAQRLNGITQQQIVVKAPDFYPTIPPPGSITNSQTFPTVYQIAPNLRAPYVMQAAASVEHQVSKAGSVALTYLHSRGVHQLLTNNINAPLPGTYDPLDPSSAVYPYGNVGNIYQYESEGVFNQNQLIANFRLQTGQMLSLFGYYTLNYANSDTAGPSSFPSNPYNVMADYGRAAFDVRHRVFLGGTIALPHAFRVSPFLVAASGRPFNISVGQDLNGDSIFNDRPAFATDLSRPSVVQTAWGAFDMAPMPGQTIVPINYGTGPAQFTMNMRVSKTFGFGKKLERPNMGGGPGGPGQQHGPAGLAGRGLTGSAGRGPGGFAAPVNRQYSLTLGFAARNIFNIVNLAPPIGNLSSPLFGQSNALAGGPFSSPSANRTIELQAMLSF
jgi:hypothetical protein